MDLLEASLEPLLALRYSAGAGAAVWAWLAAVLTAALGLWRIRLAGSDPSPKPSPPPGPAQAPAAEKPARPPPQFPRHVEDVGSPTARFTAYYSCDESCDVDEDDGRSDDGEDDGVAELDLTAAWWDLAAVKISGDLGWYRYQDWTALNGSVVRLWDGDEQMTAIRRRRKVW